MGERGKLLIATGNPGKFKEIQAILGPLPMEIVSLTAYPDFSLPEETGNTYLDNALLKAKAAGRNTGLITLAEDSGLEVDALKGAPGIRSARFSGERAYDALNIETLLCLMEQVPDQDRIARFRCVAVIYDPVREVFDRTEGVCEGKITWTPRGRAGFGYDPVFWVEDFGKTMAEIPPELKNQISHRARAFEKIRSFLPRYISLPCFRKNLYHRTGEPS